MNTDEVLDELVRRYCCGVGHALRMYSRPTALGWANASEITRPTPGRATGARREATQGVALGKSVVHVVVPLGMIDRVNHLYTSDNENEPDVLAPCMTDSLEQLSPHAYQSWLVYAPFGFDPTDGGDRAFAHALNKAGGSVTLLSHNRRSFVAVCFVAKSGRGCARYLKWKALVEANAEHTKFSSTTTGVISFLAIAITDLRDLRKDVIAPRARDVQGWIRKCEDATIVLIERSLGGRKVTISIVRHNDISTIVTRAGTGAGEGARASGGGGGSAAAAARPPSSLLGTDTGFDDLF